MSVPDSTGLIADTLHLSSLQQQVLAEMGVDAWYLTPLTRYESAEDQQHRAVISDLVDTLQMQDDTVSTLPPAPAVSVQTTPTTLPDNTSNNVKYTKATNIVDTVTTTKTAKQAARRVHTIPTVTIDRTRNVAAPTQTELAFPPIQTAPDNWQNLRKAIIAQANDVQLPYCFGIGSQQAENLLIMPPPDYPLRQRNSDSREPKRQAVERAVLHEPEQQLLSDILHSVGISLADCYTTPLLKHPMRYGLDPDAEALSAQLPLLAAELALVQPTRLWLLGTAACHAILQTAAPMSALLPKRYMLSYTTTDKRTQQADVICLPSLDYLLALPAEKSVVWQNIKKLASQTIE